jgi:hypothetical protein
MGLGYATLRGNPAIVVGCAGCRVSSLLLESKQNDRAPAACVMQLQQDAAAGPTNRTVVQDVWIKHGNLTLDYSKKLPALDALMLVEQSYAFIESAWLWRADHLQGISAGIGNDVAPARHCLWVKPGADHVCALGLQTEHSNEECTYWEGDEGTLVFLQVETNYDRRPEDATSGMRVTGSGFVGYGLGVYMYAPHCDACQIDCGVSAPEGAELHNVISVWLPGGANTAIQHVGCVGGVKSGGPAGQKQGVGPVGAFCPGRAAYDITPPYV